MNKNIFFTLIALLAISTSAKASIIFDNGSADGSRGFWSDLSHGQEMADNFLLTAGQNTITGVSWAGSYYSNNVPTATDDFTIRIFSDNGSLPGSLLNSYNVGNTVNRIDSGINDSTCALDIYNYSASFASTTLTSGVNYWLSIVNNTAGSPTDWLWENSSTSGGDSFRSSPGTAWSSFSSSMAFSLNNDTAASVPEPSILALFAAGIIGFGFARRRKLRQS